METPISLVAAILAGAALTGAAVRTWDWAVKRVSDIRAKDDFVKHFAACASLILRDEVYSVEARSLLREIAPYIQTRHLAEILSEKSKRDDFGQANNADADAFLASVLSLPQEKQDKFFSAIFFYMMALSFSSRQGRHLRRRMMRNISNRKVVIKESMRAHRAANTLDHQLAA